MAITASKLRENVYRILDEILESGVPVEIVRKGRTLRIVPAEEHHVDRLTNLVDRPEVIEGDPEELVHIDWSQHWRRPI